MTEPQTHLEIVLGLLWKCSSRWCWARPVTARYRNIASCSSAVTYLVSCRDKFSEELFKNMFIHPHWAIEPFWMTCKKLIKPRFTCELWVIPCCFVEISQIFLLHKAVLFSHDRNLLVKSNDHDLAIDCCWPLKPAWLWLKLVAFSGVIDHKSW